MADKTEQVKVPKRWFGGEIPEDKFNRYKAYCQEHRITIAALVVKAVDRFLEQLSPPPAPPQVEREEDMGISTPVAKPKKKAKG